MNTKSLSISILSVTALILFVAQFIPVQPAMADQVIKDRDYTMVTSRSTRGGDILYVIDNRGGQVAVLTWDNGTRNFQVAGVGALSALFPH